MVAELYYTSGSCGASSYIAAYKAGILGTKVNAFEADIREHKVATGPNKGKDFYAINPKGNVPVVVIDGTTVLNENAATLQWIADQNPASELAPANGTPERYLLQSKLSYLSSEVHGSFGPLFDPTSHDEVKKFCLNRIKLKFAFLSKEELRNGSKKYLVGNKFTVADSYLYIILSWCKYVGVDLADYPILKKYYEDIAALDFVKQAHAAMAAAGPK